MLRSFRSLACLGLLAAAGSLGGCALIESPGQAQTPEAAPAMPAMPSTLWAEDVVGSMADSWPDDHRRPFLKALAPMAMRSGAEHCIPPSVTVAQGILESGWGRSENAVELNNLFGIKAARHEAGASAPTWEYVGGKKVRRHERFRRFESWRDAVRQHDRRLAEHPAYAPAREARQSGPDFVEAIAPVYATDPAYAERIRGLVEQYGLDALDGPALERAEARQRCG
jgi:flagellum-specific peptidoglycan hydrolase FlgJ